MYTDANARDDKGNHALFYSTKNQDYEFVDFLLNLGADVNIKNFNGNTVVHIAFKINDEKLIV